MKTTIRKAAQIGLGAAATFCTAGFLQAQTLVYDNSGAANALNIGINETTEFGDDIVIDSTGLGPGAVTVVQFNLEVGGTAGADEGGTLRFYNNNGANNGPGDLLNSFAFNIPFASNTSADNLYTVSISDMNMALPDDDFIFTVEFASSNPQLNIFNGPQTGSNFPDYWVFNGSTWDTQGITSGPNAGTAVNFGAQVYAVPEPTTFALGLLGGLALLGLRFVRRRA